jgi:hypothetical protein|tara:strand:- start:3130 stop:3705 length:576 start_codon:yes stop_codon:yes gene_type:complete
MNERQFFSIFPKRLRGAGLGLILTTFILGACSAGQSGTVYPDDNRRRTGSDAYDTSVDNDSILGEDGGNIFGGGSKPDASKGGGGIGVNAFLWRASLDTLSFLPLASADPFGGVIITEWYSPPEARTDRFKVNIFILGRDLRADGVRASVFRQSQNAQGQWVDAAVDKATGTDLEDTILIRARQLRINNIN